MVTIEKNLTKCVSKDQQLIKKKTTSLLLIKYIYKNTIRTEFYGFEILWYIKKPEVRIPKGKHKE